MTSTGSHTGTGAFTRDVMHRLAATTLLRPHTTLSGEQCANVAPITSHAGSALVTAFSGTNNHLDLWDLSTGAHRQRLPLDTTAQGQSSGIMVLSPQAGQTGATIRDLSMAPSGQLIAVACGQSVRLIALHNGQRLEPHQTLTDQNTKVHAVTFNHTGDMLATANDAGQILLWNMTERAILSTLTLDDARLRCLSFSQDDLLLATGDTDGNVAVWDVVTGHQMAYFQAHQSQVRQVCFGPHGYLLATCGDDGLARLWDMAEARPFGNTMPHGGAVYDVIIHRAGNLMTSCGADGKIGVWRMDNQTLVDAYETPGPVLALGQTPDEQHLVLVTSQSLRTLHFGHGASNVRPPEPFASASVAAASEVALSPLSGDPYSGQGSEDLIISDVDDDYLQARATSGVGGWNQAPPSLSNFESPESNPSSAPGSFPGSSPGSFPGQTRPAAQVAQSMTQHYPVSDSSPLIPARSSSLNKVLADVKATNQRPHIVRRNLYLKIAVALSFLVAGAGAAAGYGTNPAAVDHPGYETQIAPLNDELQQALSDEDLQHKATLQPLQNRLETLKQNVRTDEIRGAIEQVDQSITQEMTRHAQARQSLQDGQQAQRQRIEESLTGDPLHRALMGGALAFIVSLILLWLISVILTPAPKQKPS